MANFKVLTNENYNDVKKLCENIWDGNDYVPDIFHKWVAEKEGCFIGLFEDDKLVGLGKYTVLIDRQGWLEGLRIHPDSRGKGYANLISDKLLNIAKEDLKNNIITNIGMCTHKDTTASIHMMTNRGFKLEQSCMLVFKNINNISNNLSLENFDAKTWYISYEDLVELDYFKNFNNKIVHGFTYINLCKDVYNDLVTNNSLISVNGYKAILKSKADFVSIMCLDESIDSINTITDYCLLKYKCNEIDICLTSSNSQLIKDLKSHNFECLDEFENDCLYFSYPFPQ